MTSRDRTFGTGCILLALVFVGCASAPAVDTPLPEALASVIGTSALAERAAPIATKLCGADAMGDCERACNDGGVLSCVRWAHMLRAGVRRLSIDYAMGDDRMPPAPSIARRLYVRGCEAGFGEACRVAGEMVESGEGGDADAARALELFERACNANSAIGCHHVGRLALEARHTERALEVLSRSCDLGEMQACMLTDEKRTELERSGAPVAPPRPGRSGGADRKSGVVCPAGTSMRREISTTYGVSRPSIFCALVGHATKHGPFAEWASFEDEAASNGVVSTRGEYRDGDRAGAWEERDLLGEVRASGRYVDGEKEGVWTERSGRREETITYSHGRPHGPYSRVDHDDEEREEGTYDNGKKTGVWRRTRRNGDVDQSTYVNGREVPRSD